ncbi:two-component system sensor histidine kinase [Ligilactobacillus salitolerans]|uniref:histidine kinase n=1 Tax=Ligilactobacillus salitolerans TaxID=1808352 RepID=A0A401IV35_9LACO|nr:ATP-binding protein [Ligilactobacillus salitolerans]GBG95392.1 two-component system sensor histidine kinase [Ligilactobacillus salitolerans]
MKVRRFFLALVSSLLAVACGVIFKANWTKTTVSQAVTDFSWNWLLLLVLLTALFVWALYEFENRRQKKLLQIFSDKLEKIAAGQKTGPVILAQKNELYPLSRAINQTQSMTAGLTKDYDRQKRGYLGLLEYVPIGVMVIDQDREIYLSNHYLNEILERELDISHDLYYTIMADFDLVKLTEETFRTKEDQHGEIQVELPDQQKVLDVRVIYIPLSTHHFYVMLLVDDITERKKIERMQHDFVSNVSHELKTPVTSITGFSETLQEGALNDPEATRKFVEIIHQESLRLTDLINDILSLSRIGPETQINQQQVDLKKIVQQNLQLFGPDIKARKLTVKNDIPAQLKVWTDPSKLGHILTNLLQNAIRYNKEAGQITLSAKTEQEHWSITIADTGIGMTAEQRTRIFERFYRADTSRSKEVEGTGLGLAIVKEYVDLLSGQISVHSQIKEGSSFTVSFPLKAHFKGKAE